MGPNIRGRDDLRGKKVTVMGLGLHGGGLAAASFLHDSGAEVTVTDLRDENTLAPSIRAMEGRRVRYVLGRHEMADFSGADFVVKNPAVKPDSPYLAAARAVETDISIFLKLSRSPLVAVTGSKGKSSTASAIQHGFVSSGMASLLGGNITVSPLDFLERTGPDRPVVLELSSWQLADIQGMGVLKPKVAVLTAIMPDHMNHYKTMAEYVAHKRLIYADQGPGDYTICDTDQDWGLSFARETRALPVGYGARDRGGFCGWIQAGPRGMEDATGWCRLPESCGGSGSAELIVPEGLLVRGIHMRRNLLAAGIALRLMGCGAEQVRAAAASFPGIEHRMEFFAEASGVRYYNDSAATIPQATAAALESFSSPVVLVAGGTDKNIDFEPVADAYARARRIVLLAGTGTDKLIPLLKARGIGFDGPHDRLEAAVDAAIRIAQGGDSVLLSPGCTSFGMFLHEFDRGRKWKQAVLRALGIGDGQAKAAAQ